MNHKKSDNGNLEAPFYGLLDNGPDDDLAPEGEALRVFWHFKDEAFIDPKNAYNDKYLKEVTQLVIERIDRWHSYEHQALHFVSTSELLKWIRSDDDRLEWACSNGTYNNLLQQSN
jgi:hypothetical protein